MRVECCDNCKKPFEQFDMEQTYDNTKSGITKAWGVVVRDGDIEALMSDLESAFICFVDKSPVRQDGCEYWCVNCVDACNEGDDVNPIDTTGGGGGGIE